MKKTISYLPVFIPCLCILMLSGCNSYYKVLQAPANTIEDKAGITKKLLADNRYFILRNGQMSYYMGNIKYNENIKTITSILENVPADHMVYLNSKKGKKSYDGTPGNPENMILNEVHYFVKPDSTTVTGAHTLALENIQKIEIIETDKNKAKSRRVMVAIITTGAILSGIALIALGGASALSF